MLLAPPSPFCWLLKAWCDPVILEKDLRNARPGVIGLETGCPASMIQPLSTSFCCDENAWCAPVARATDLRTLRVGDARFGDGGPSAMIHDGSTSFCCALKALCIPVALLNDFRTPRSPLMVSTRGRCRWTSRKPLPEASNDSRAPPILSAGRRGGARGGLSSIGVDPRERVDQMSTRSPNFIGNVNTS